MHLFFPSDPLNKKMVDEALSDEWEAAKNDCASFPRGLISHEMMDKKLFDSAVVKSNSEYKGLALYRGWMMSPDQYFGLYNELASHNIFLMTPPEHYEFCHMLPMYYGAISDVTSKTAWLPLVDKNYYCLSDAMDVLKQFNGKAVILKDYVKSEKAYWNEACFIPDSSDSDHVENVIMKFLSLRGDKLIGGLVFREFMELEGSGKDEKTGMPLSKEHRIFMLDGQPILSCQYLGSKDTELNSISSIPKEMLAVAKRIPSRFFSMDLVRTKEGKWQILELGDGQVAGIPSGTDPSLLYRALGVQLGEGEKK